MADCETSRDSEDYSHSSVCSKPLLRPIDSLAENKVDGLCDIVTPCNDSNPVSLTNSTCQNTKMAAPVDSYLMNMFGPVPERCVTFCIDTSGSMFRALDVVKEQLMETLSSLATREDKPMFNLIEFNSKVTQWADRLVQCTPETVAVARQWVSSLTAKTGTNTQDALLTALADPACQAVYLVTDDIPDQHTEEVLDKIIEICCSRRIHCIYITHETADDAATEFLEDLAVETFGSFNIVKLSSQGSIEKIIPVYRSEPSHEKLVWTVNNTLRPNIKTCSISTTLQLDPDEILGLYPHTRSMLFNPGPLALPPSLLSTFPDRYYYPHYWSRYHPAKVWLKAHDKLQEPPLGFSLVAGSLILGKKVIARRLEDGYFYRGTIQSQNLGRSFLVSFGPSKHGKYHQTEYQDVFIFDIVDYTDALRHTIITGDRVLAPWEPDGERFAPGIVIEGQEKRQADGPDDYDLTVSFSNGQTVKVPRDVAVWIPPAMYDRLSLELQMPASARKIMFSKVKNYPFENLPGYPTIDCPREYFRGDPFVVEPSSYLWDPAFSLYPPSLSAFYGYPPFVIKQKADKAREKCPTPAGTCDEDSALIPNTGMTKRELEDRVVSQIMEHRISSGEGTKIKPVNESTTSTPPKILGRREKQEENHLNKHVHFQGEETNEEQSMRESKYFDDSDYDVYGNLIKKSDSAVNTDSSLLFYTSPGIGHRPGWKKFWHNDPSPSFNAICGGFGGIKRLSNAKSFRETALQALLEARDQRNPRYDVVWPSSIFNYVDPFAKYDHSNSVRDCLSAPTPPKKQGASPCVRSYTVGSRPIANMTAEEREEVRRANRRRRVLKREAEWQERLVEEDNMKTLMQDNHRERILNQLERDRQRQIQEQVDLQRVREAKKKINSELRAQIEANQKEEAEKEGKRIAALAKRRERREQIQAQHDKEIQECVDRREQIRTQNNEARMKASTERLDEEAIQAAKVEKQHHNAKLQRLHHFQKLEREGQKKKNLRIAVTEQHQAIQRSQIFS